MDPTQHIRDAIETLLRNVSGINKVYTYPRVVRSYQQFVTDFGTGEVADGPARGKGWTLMITSVDTPLDANNRGPAVDSYMVHLRAAWSEYDSGRSEIDFVRHVNEVRVLLTTHASLLQIPNILRAGPAQVREMGFVEWDNRLSHFAHVEYPVKITAIRHLA